MVPVKKIVITRVEGPIKLCDRPMEFKDFNSASAWLASQSPTFPKDGGYDKHDFTVEFEDGETYSGRLDCMHFSCRNADLDVKRHIVSHCEWMSGRTAHPWCGEEEYRRMIATYEPATIKAYGDFLDKYLKE